jgi:ribosome-associated heat shock protein Hsp15
MTGPDTIRLDRWLWHARFFKTRAIAARLCGAGRVRIDGVPVAKAHAAVRVGVVLTFPHARRIRVVRVLALGTRRGPATEARRLYEELGETPPLPRLSPFVAALVEGRL